MRSKDTRDLGLDGTHLVILALIKTSFTKTATFTCDLFGVKTVKRSLKMDFLNAQNGLLNDGSYFKLVLLM